MAAVCTTDRGDVAGVPRRRQPVMHGSTDLPPLNRGFAGAMVSGDEQDHPVARPNGVIEAPINCAPCPVQTHAVKIDGPVRLDRTAPQLLVPAAIQRPLGDRDRLGSCMSRSPRPGRRVCRRTRLSWLLSWGTGRQIFSRQGPNRSGDAGPEVGFVRAERAHARRPPWGSGSAPRRRPTFHLPSKPPGRRTPRRCRSGWVP